MLKLFRILFKIMTLDYKLVMKLQEFPITLKINYYLSLKKQITENINLKRNKYQFLSTLEVISQRIVKTNITNLTEIFSMKQGH